MNPTSIKNIFLFIPSLLTYWYNTRKFRNTDFFAYKTLAHAKFECPKFLVSVCLYGNYKAIAKLRSKRFNFIREYLEHGMCYYTNIESAEQMGYINRPFITTVYTFSEQRKQVLETYFAAKNISRTIIPVGPYILGSSNFLSEDARKSLKKTLKKTLVVFPSHSIDYIQSEFDSDTLLNEIARLKPQFDTVLICVYWLDILHNKHAVYEEAGYTIISAGHRSDPNFLPRLRDIIELSDHTMSNNVGTHIGYSICLGKPHYFFSQTLNYTIKKNPFMAEGQKNIDSSTINKRVQSLFGEFQETITKEQIQLIQEFWGTW